MTSLTDMPADIVEAARKHADEWRNVDPSQYEGDFFAELADGFASAILAERQRNQWQDIATAPKDGTDILVSIFKWGAPQFGRATVIASCDEDMDGQEKWYADGEAIYPPTHWHPLPGPPSEGA